jgi:hypothetical protein
MLKSLALIPAVALVCGVGAAHAGDPYGSAQPMDEAALQGSTGMFAFAEAVAVSENFNETTQANLQGVVGACIVCEGANSNETSQESNTSAAARANSANTSEGNVNVGEFAGSQSFFD